MFSATHTLPQHTATVSQIKLCDVCRRWKAETFLKLSLVERERWWTSGTTSSSSDKLDLSCFTVRLHSESCCSLMDYDWNVWLVRFSAVGCSSDLTPTRIDRCVRIHAARTKTEGVTSVFICGFFPPALTGLQLLSVLPLLLLNVVFVCQQSSDKQPDLKPWRTEDLIVVIRTLTKTGQRNKFHVT